MFLIFEFLIWVPYSGSLFEFPIRGSYSLSLFELCMLVPNSGSLFWILSLPGMVGLNSIQSCLGCFL